VAIGVVDVEVDGIAAGCVVVQVFKTGIRLDNRSVILARCNFHNIRQLRELHVVVIACNGKVIGGGELHVLKHCTHHIAHLEGIYQQVNIVDAGAGDIQR